MKRWLVGSLCGTMLSTGGCRKFDGGAEVKALTASSDTSTQEAGGLWIIALRDTVFKRAGTHGKQSEKLPREDKCWVAKGSRLLLERVVEPDDRTSDGHARVAVKPPYRLRSLPVQLGFETDDSWDEILRIVEAPLTLTPEPTPTPVKSLSQAMSERSGRDANDEGESANNDALGGNTLRYLLPTKDKNLFGNGYASCPFREGDIYEEHWRGAVLEERAVQPIAMAEPKDANDALEAARMRPGWIFPVPSASGFCEGAGGGAGGFGTRREGGLRKHAGCDLYTKTVGQDVLAVADGTVIQPEYLFYCFTTALEVRNDDGTVVRYGELAWFSSRGLRLGQRVRKGQVVGKIGRLNCYFQSMLHFEVYSGTGRGPLSTSRWPYRRRSDLLDPTSLLRAAHQKLGSDKEK